MVISHTITSDSLRLTWLHLSDWHQRGKDFDRKVVRDALIDDIKNRTSIDARLATIDFVVFSGDVTFSGLSEEFESARMNLFDPVLEATGLSPDALFMVPGNHDLSREIVYEMLPPELNKTLDSDAKVQKWLTDDRRLSRSMEPFEAYTKFVTGYSGQSTPPFASISLRTLNGLDVALLGLNSAWMCGRNKKADDEVDDYGQLVLGEPQIHDALREIADADVRIAVLHHPFEWLQPFERGQIKSRLTEGCHFILRGHEHEPGADWHKSPQGECMVIPAGAAYDRRKASNPRYVNAYNFVHSDLTAGNGLVFFRRWSERRGKWIEDTDSAESGPYSFRLPKNLGAPTKDQATAPKSRPSISSNLAAFETNYRRQTIEAFKDLSFKGLTASVRPILLPLEEVYVQLRAVAEVPESADEFTPEERRVLRWMEEDERAEGASPADLRDAQLRLDALRRERWTKERLERFPIGDALKNPTRRGLVILGDPGCGKTTLLHFLALIFARGAEAVAQHLGLSGKDAARLPIFAPLAAYDDMLNSNPGLTVREFLAEYHTRRRAMPGLAPLIESALDSGQALILLDGMDEVLEEDRRKFVADQASAFIRNVIDHGNRVLLTSRIYGYRTAPLSVDLPHVTVLDFRREEIEVFARQWNQAMANWEYSDRTAEARRLLAQNEEQSLMEEIRSNPGVERLASNPLLLSMLALLRRQVGRLPQQRIRLYSLYLNALIDAWEISRSPGARLSSPSRPDSTRIELVLIPLALWLQQNKPSGTATKEELLTQITAVFLREQGFPESVSQERPEWAEAQGRAVKFLEDMRQFSGLLVERGKGAFGFRHLTFQEYYVGRALARMGPNQRWNLLQPNLHANRWREPILLATAQLGNMQADEDACTAFVQNILEANSPDENILHRDLFLAADCAADDINVHILTLRQIVTELNALTLSQVPMLATQAIQKLASLAVLGGGETPRVPEAEDVLISRLDSDGEFSLGPARLMPLITPVVLSHAALRAAVTEKLNDGSYHMLAAAIQALAGLLAENPDLRAAVTEKLNNYFYIVRVASIQALAGLLAENPELRAAVTEKLNDSDNDVRGAALQALGGLLPESKELRAAVTEKLNDDFSNVRAAAVEALAGLLAENQELRTAVTEKLNDEAYYVRAAAIQALAGLLPESKELRAAVTEKLNDSDNDVRAAAIQALAGLLPESKELRAAVTEKLNDSDNDVRAAAIQALAGLLPENQELRAAVAQKLNDESSNVRATAIRAVLKLKAYESEITGLMSHRDWITRRDSAVALSDYLATGLVLASRISRVLDDTRCLEVSTMRERAIQSLSNFMTGELRASVTEKLNDSDTDVRAAAIQALAGLLAENPELRAAVTEKLNDESYNVRAAAIQALAGLLAENQELRDAFREKLNDDFSNVRAAAVQALAGLLTETQELRAAVAEKLNDESYGVRAAAVEALAGLLAQNPELRAAVTEKLNDESYNVRAAAVEALAGLLDQNRELRAAIAERLNDENYRVRAAAIRALAGLLAENPELCVAVTEKLNDSDYRVRAAAIQALADLLGENHELRAAITEKLNDADNDVRAAAIQALAGFLAENQELLAAVTERLSDESYNVRQAAIQALAGFLAENQELRAAVTEKLNNDSSNARAAAIQALAGFLAENPELRAAVTEKLNDESYNVRAAAIQALAGFLAENQELRDAFTEKLNDDSSNVRGAAIHALSGVLADHSMLRAAIADKLKDSADYPRGEAVLALAAFVSDAALRESLKPVLATDDHAQFGYSYTPSSSPSARLVQTWGDWLRTNPNNELEVVELLSSEDWRVRLNAIRILAATGPDAVRRATQSILTAIDDLRGYDSWPARIAAADILLNHSEYEERAINILLEASEYGSHPLVTIRESNEIRKIAALALGKLKAERYRPEVAQSLRKLLQTERDPKVLDGLVQALLSLASAPA